MGDQLVTFDQLQQVGDVQQEEDRSQDQSLRDTYEWISNTCNACNIFCGYALLMYTVVRLYVCQAPQNFFLTLTRLENGCDKFCIFLLQLCCLHSFKNAGWTSQHCNTHWWHGNYYVIVSICVWLTELVGGGSILPAVFVTEEEGRLCIYVH